MQKAKLIAYYLPQFHSIPENDKWWGAGFTEWTNVKNAKPLFKNHKQPRKPGFLGYYNLLDIDTQRKQIELARQYDIYGFSYYHYWFGNGKMLLEKPVELMLSSKDLDFPFCLSWANESWEGIWHGSPGKLLIEQTYPGKKDYIQHFEYLLKFFSDSRYIRFDNKPVFTIHRPDLIPDIKFFVEIFRELADKAGFDGIYLIGGYNYPMSWKLEDNLFDAIISNGFVHASNILYTKKYSYLSKQLMKIEYKFNMNKPLIYDFEEIDKIVSRIDDRNIIKFCGSIDEYFPLLTSNWDNTPRLGRKGYLLDNFNTKTFKKHVNRCLDAILNNKNKVVFVKSWNEWAEGNYLEPDVDSGLTLLETIKEQLNNSIT